MEYTKAVRKDTNLLIAIAGATGSGKTYSAMELATGLCLGEPFLFVDTEGRRGLHYADYFDFEHYELKPTYEPSKYITPIVEAERRGFKAVVIDSMTHEWEGEGGVVEMAEAQRASKGEIGMWAEPKRRHKQMMTRLMHARPHLIFCLRAEDKLDITGERDAKGKLVVDSKYAAICEKRFMFDMTCSFMMTAQAPGVPDFELPNKIHDMHRLALPPSQLVTRDAGVKLGTWAAGGDIAGADKELWDRARQAAYQGRTVLEMFAESEIDNDERKRLRPIAHELNRLAREADELNLQNSLAPETPAPVDPEKAQQNVSDLFGDR